MKISDVWVVLPANNLGAVHDNTEIYLTKEAAERAAHIFNGTKVDGYANWTVGNLDAAISEKVDEACSNAMDEG